MLHVVTAGIERNIILHSPTPSSPCTQNLARTRVETRVLSDDSESDRVTYFRALSGTPLQNVGDRDPDSMAISLFDQ
jgi:WD repeat-containing protein 22